MKRHRVIVVDFDSRAITLDTIQEHWEEQVKELHRQNQERLIARLRAEFGELAFDAKLANFKELGAKPFSVVAFHNRFLSQARQAFVHCLYYPALTGACALGERILNHLILGLRDSYKSHPLYKKVYRKDSFDYWPLVIDVLSEWGVLTPEATASFRLLNEKRNNALHFNLATEINDRQLALEAIKNVEEVVSHQFSGFGLLPWLLPAPGECYIKREYEPSPFVQLIYLPNCVYLGYKHVVTSVFPWAFQDFDDYPNQEVSDEEFLALFEIVWKIRYC
jgi:hypothetical protein